MFPGLPDIDQSSLLSFDEALHFAHYLEMPRLFPFLLRRFAFGCNGIAIAHLGRLPREQGNFFFFTGQCHAAFTGHAEFFQQGDRAVIFR